MTITVSNASTVEIRVAINQWGSDGSTDFYTIGISDNESWNRSDPKGFLMVVRQSGHANTTYFVKADDQITIREGTAELTTDPAKKLKPVVEFQS